MHGDEREREAAQARVRERDARRADVHRLLARHAHERERERAEAREPAERVRERVLVAAAALAFRSRGVHADGSSRLTSRNDGRHVQVMSRSRSCGHDATIVRKMPLLSYPPWIANVALMDVSACRPTSTREIASGVRSRRCIACGKQIRSSVFDSGVTTGGSGWFGFGSGFCGAC